MQQSIKTFSGLTAYLKLQLYKGTERSVKAKKNILGIIMIKAVSFGIQFLLVPLTLRYLNPSEYGIWLTLSSIVAWFALFDLGLGNGLKNRFAEAIAVNDFRKARTYLSTTYLLFVIIIGVVGITFLVVNTFIDWSVILNAPTEMKTELLKLALVVFGFYCLQFVFKTITVVVTADQKPALAELLQLFVQLSSLVAVALLVRFTHGSILNLGIAMSASPVVVFVVATLILFSKRYKYISPSFRYVDLSFGKSLFRIGIKFLLIQIAYIGIFQTNNIIIAQVCNNAEVTVFHIAHKYMSISYIAFTIFITPLWSAFTEAYTLGDYPWMKGTFKKINLFAFAPLFAMLFLALLSGIAYKLWIGDTITIPRNTTYLMAIYMVLSIWVFLYTSILNGVGKVLVQLIVYAVSMVLHIPIAIYLGGVMGINGVILSASLFMAVITLTSYYQVNNIIQQKVTGIWDK
jgi:O-antigen/teichoic acid export membrane protein